MNEYVHFFIIFYDQIGKDWNTSSNLNLNNLTYGETFLISVKKYYDSAQYKFAKSDFFVPFDRANRTKIWNFTAGDKFRIHHDPITR